MKHFATLLLTGITLGVAPKPAAAQQAPSPYHTRPAVEVPVLAVEAAASGFGLYRSMQRDGLTNAELAALNKQDVPAFDRFSAGYYSASYNSHLAPLLADAVKLC